MFVEELRVDVEDEVADDVEPEVAGLDHAGVDRADGDLVRSVAAHGNGPRGERHVMVDKRAQRRVTREADAVEVGGFSLVPAGRRGEIDDRDGVALVSGERFDSGQAVFTDQERADLRTVRGCVEARETPSGRERFADGGAVTRRVTVDGVAHVIPLTSA